MFEIPGSPEVVVADSLDSRLPLDNLPRSSVGALNAPVCLVCLWPLVLQTFKIVRQGLTSTRGVLPFVLPLYSLHVSLVFPLFSLPFLYFPFVFLFVFPLYMISFVLSFVFPLYFPCVCFVSPCLSLVFPLYFPLLTLCVSFVMPW